MKVAFAHLLGGRTLVFTAVGRTVSGPATETDQRGNATSGTVYGGINGTTIAVEFENGDLWHFNASVDKDGSAEGVFDHDGGIRTGTWHTSAPLKCFDS